MEAVLKAHGFDQFQVRWMTEHDREELLTEYHQGCWGNPHKIAAASVSLILKHLAAYRAITANPVGSHLILEDDILVSLGALAKMNELEKELPKDWELFFVGAGCDLHVPWWKRRKGKRVYFRGWKPWWRAGAGCSRCTEGYFVNPAFAAKLLKSRFAEPPFESPIDWHLNKAGYEMKIRSYWAEPPVLTQGAFESWTKNRELNELLTDSESGN